MCSETSKEHMLVFQGFRLISTAWIVFGHTPRLWSDVALLNKDELEKYYLQWYAIFAGGFGICVDTFFYMSGFLLAYNYLKSRSESLATHIKSLPKFYIHRYLRLVPPMMMVYFMSTHLLVHMTNGPFNVINAKGGTNGCDPLWPFLLFVQNYFSIQHFCLPNTWYLSADMQMYLLSPLIIIPLAMKLKRKEFKSSMVLLLILNVTFYILPIVVELVISDPSRINYPKTHPRLITFGCGIMMGTFMRERKHVPFLSNRLSHNYKEIINLILWVFTIPIMFAITYAFYITYHNDAAAIYLVLPRPLWCLCLSWITYSCYHGYGGIVNWILTRSFMQVGGKLSYSIYLLQTISMYLYINSLRSRISLNVLHSTMNFLGILAISTALAFFWYLAFEAPVGVLDKLIFNKKAKKPAGESNGQNVGMS